MSDFDVKRNLTMLTDFYEITMANGYFKSGFKDTIAFFDMFFRKVPDDGGFAIMAGVEQLVEYLKNLKFEPEDIEYLRGRGFGEEFLDYLANFKFVCDVYAIPEGTSAKMSPRLQPPATSAFTGSMIKPQARLLRTLLPPRPTELSGLRTAERLWSSAPAGHRAGTAPFTAPGPHISAAA